MKGVYGIYKFYDRQHGLVDVVVGQRTAPPARHRDPIRFASFASPSSTFPHPNLFHVGPPHPPPQPLCALPSPIICAASARALRGALVQKPTSRVAAEAEAEAAEEEEEEAAAATTLLGTAATTPQAQATTRTGPTTAVVGGAATAATGEIATAAAKAAWLAPSTNPQRS
ncbi:hypothetical protein OsJ_07301 [Oryza sativa Japonica Group]|uniref:Uncharacterized protein n=1 Tax=Oryza sativa subsp. japonica TaxID=39947 RepID=B9F0S2_ORYSJ|nr:hypothetical protein OsJ_07301 [Oryza sativa Japonica Group]